MQICCLVCQDPRDAPPPTRAETRDERLERKVEYAHCLLMLGFCIFKLGVDTKLNQSIKSELRDYMPVRATCLCLLSKNVLCSQRREKIERRQTVVETELKLCRFYTNNLTCVC